MRVYQARFMKYLENRGLIEEDGPQDLGAFVGDGETDEVEAHWARSRWPRARS